MNKNKIQARAGVLGYGFDADQQSYLVYLDFVGNYKEVEKQWDKFFDEVNDGRFENLVKITIEKCDV